MSLVKDTVANFIGGVSQQVDKLMYPNQARNLVNYQPSPSVGLKDRPPTEHVAKLMGALNVHPLIQTVIKEDEEYVVVLTGSGIKVFDLEGNEKTVTYADNTVVNYITTNSPLKDLTATTIGDYTFILNRKILTKMSTAKSPNTYASSALIFVKQGDYSTDYKINVTHSLPFNEELLLFSDTSEFSIKGGDIFSNSTVGCDLTMEYPCSKYCKPINAGGTGFFLFENGKYSRVMEIYITSTYSINARDITEQVPSYLPSGMYKIAGSTANNIACFL